MGVSRSYRVGSPFNGSELIEVDYEQTTDTMYLAHLDHAPPKLVRLAHDEWQFTNITFGADIAAPAGLSATATVPNTDAPNSGAAYFPQSASYAVTAVNDATGQEGRASNTSSATNDLTLKRNYNTLGWSAVTGATRYNVYKADNSQFLGYIGTTETLGFTDDNIGPALDLAPPELDNPFAAVNDYPSTVTLFEQRLLYARTRNRPNGIWGSRAGFAEYENFDKSRPLRPSDAFSMAIVSGKVNAVNQLAATTDLLALSSDNIFKIDGDGNGGVLSATAQSARREIGRGSSRLRPIFVDNVVFYQPSIGNSVRTINFSFENDGYRSNDISIFSPHLLEGATITSWCYAQEPRSLIWAVRSDGKLLCLTWEQEQSVWGWTLCETDGLFKSVCCITENGEDRVYLIVERTISSVQKTFVERMASVFWDTVADTCFVDCGISQLFETPQSSAAGHWHLEGRTDIVALVDGSVYTGLTVTNGVVTLPQGDGLKWTVGIPFTVEIDTLPIRFQSQGIGSNAGRKQQVGEIVLHLQETSGIEVGPNTANLFHLKQRSNESYGAPDDLLDGHYLTDSANVVSGDVGISIRQTAPLPLTLLGVFLDPVINS